MHSLEEIWGSIPQEYHCRFLAILVHTGQIYRMNKEYFFLPNIFPVASIPEDEIPPITRRFYFMEMKVLNFCKLVQEIHELVSGSPCIPTNTILCNIQKYRIDIESPEGELCSIAYDFASNCVSLVSYEEDLKRTLFCALSNSLNQFFLSDSTLKRCDPFSYVSIGLLYSITILIIHGNGTRRYVYACIVWIWDKK